MKAIFLWALIFSLINCNGQESKTHNLTKDSRKLNNNNMKMEKLDITLWKKKALQYMAKRQGEELQAQVVNSDTYYYFEGIGENRITVEFSGDDKEGYSMVKTLPLPNIYKIVNFYNTEGELLYNFETLIANPNIVIGIHREYDKNGQVIKEVNYDEGFRSRPEDIVKIIKSNGGSIDNDLTIIDRDKNKTINSWHVEFLVPKFHKVRILKVEDGTMKILKEEERESDFLED